MKHNYHFGIGSSWFVNGRCLLGQTLLSSLLAAVACNAGKDSSGGDNGGASSAGAGGGIHVGRGGSGGKAQGGETSTPFEPTVCGDGRQGSSEACDDGNTRKGDGCATDCQSVEENYVCLAPGEACVPAQTCGDKKISGSENCDDGNAKSGDGCSSACHTEPGYACSFVGTRCKAAVCGDGIVAGQESCDDGQSPPVDGDGCSSTCMLESPTAVELNAWVCPVPGQVCERTTCGNAIVEGSEQCDDGNHDTADGCTPACRKEPNCPSAGGACSSVCGDGMMLASDTDQACDDGNSVNGDGCSSDCKVEPGYGCDNELASDTSLVLPVVLRDFRGKAEPNGHPDFENYNKGFERGIVQTWLDAQGKPQHATVDKNNTENTYAGGVLSSSVDYFAMWYRDDPEYNKTVLQTLSFQHLTSGEYQYANTSFFLLTGLGWGNYGTTGKNFHFTSEVRYWFEYRGGETLQFKGDDDVWVFVNKQLAVDLGGVHSAINGSVVLGANDGSGTVCENASLGCPSPKTVALGLEPGKVYEIVVFQAERHTSASNYTLTLSSFNKTRSICHSDCGDGTVTPDEACDLGTERNTGVYGTCTADCKLPAYCGDGHVDSSEGEQCDDGVNLSTYGYNSTPACNPSCKWTHYCGDKQVDGLFGEECDDGNHVAGDGCEANCTNRAGCGNGVVEAGEDCDDGNAQSGDGCSEFCSDETILL